MDIYIEVILLTNFVPKVEKLAMKVQRLRKVSLETEILKGFRNPSTDFLNT